MKVKHRVALGYLVNEDEVSDIMIQAILNNENFSQLRKQICFKAKIFFAVKFLVYRELTV